MNKTTLQRLGFVAILLAVGAGYVWGTYEFFTRRYNGGNDLFVRYAAWRAYLFEGRDPYSPEVTREIQVGMWGRPSDRPGEAEMVYPLYALVVQWPFVFMPWEWARALYMVLCQVFIVVGLILTARLLEWKLNSILFVGMALWAIVFYPEARGVILGQIVITQYLFAVLALWCLREKQEVWGGICLALTTVRPPAVFLFVPFLLVYALARRRWRFIWSFGISLALLLGVSFLVLPSWFTEWMTQVLRYPGYTVGQSPVWLFAHMATNLGTVGEWALNLICYGGMAAAWWLALRRPDDRGFHWALGMTLVVSNLTAMRSATTNYIFLLFPTYLVFAALLRAWPRGGRWAVLAVQLTGLVGLWWLFFATVQGDQEQAIMYIPQPVLIGLVLLAGYRWLLADNLRAKVTL